ncbi:MAG: amylo-alpha-1,6-glucosidase [Acidobacteriota bacterium]|nr:amylo-alpha-1,6-glucosidase [Acidobacteriota bacterium]MDH3528107.1 amylo-alpha-1,6-glucosidase [Acidobacteriota bacterium]
MIEFKEDTCTAFEQASRLEWLETNGIGGFASSTVSCANTRRYHSLLTAATKPPLGRITALSKFEEIVTIDGVAFEISANQYTGSIHPRGFEYLSRFRLDPFPVWTYEFGGIELERRIFMVNGENTTVCAWKVLSKVAGRDADIGLEIKPLVSFVSYHGLQREDPSIQTSYQTTDNCVLINPFPGEPELFFCHSGATHAKSGHWYYGFQYPIEKERGFDFSEDLFQPFTLSYDLRDEAVVIISTKQHDHRRAPDYEEKEIDRRKKLTEIAGPKDAFEKQLVHAADQFIVDRGSGKTVLAGYPWFSDWGRDTMIALPGLALATNREGIAKNILREFSEHISEGMLPNRFPDEGETPEYNTADATLWYFEAIRAYLEKTKDFEFVKDELYEKLVEIIFWHRKGTRFGIRVAEDGLLEAGVPGLQLTWMDAKYGDEVFTPRIGKPVEIQALWYNALETIRALALKFEDTDGRRLYREMSSKAKKTFNKEFWNKDGGYLYDVIGDNFKDDSIRPNQIFAVSLKHSMVSMYRAKKIVQVVERELFTPVGLRSLAPSDPAYRGVYTGSPCERDSAYHQGTVWAWLMGAFVESLRRTYPKGRKFKQYELRIRRGFEKHLEEHGVGQVSEIFDGDEPHKPRGCFAQAWSVAELLRVFD